MAIKGLNSIIKQREEQYGNMFNNQNQNNDDIIEILNELKTAISVLADNQQKLYQKLDLIENKLQGE